ncbi:hypothetical protein HHI36_002073 [Cryptolaemus montrouzieri]|uniref:Generative cell specific-1/HAP2 domain-containing protein n=1 Tax=Cryptolaemus montrouzieri TaxID=559131 RepID=A0ABD2PA65_9CUCU
MCLLPHFKLLQSPLYIHLLILSLNLLYNDTLQTEMDFQKEWEEEKRSCCHSNSPSFEIRAIMIPCSVKYCPCSNIPGQTTSPKPPDFVSETSEDSCSISNCTKKLIITVKMTNIGPTRCKSQYVVVDHVYDPSSEHKQRLLYPYVLKINQKPIMQTYTLHKECSVNEKSTELVLNKNDKDYKGCKVTGEDTTCQKVYYKNKPVPYSAGFCCSCEDDELANELEKFDNEQKLLEETMKNQSITSGAKTTNAPKTNVKRDISSEKSHAMKLFTEKCHRTSQKPKHQFVEKELSKIEQILNAYHESDFGADIEKTPIHIRRKEDSETVDKIDMKNELQAPKKIQKKKTKKKVKEDPVVVEDYLKNNIEDLKTGFCEPPDNNTNNDTCFKEEFNETSPYLHPRGGQDCSNKTCPSDVDPQQFHQSTHCLIFSKLWYTVYKLGKPEIFHELTLEIFEKHEDLMGHVLWKDITDGKPLVLGTLKGDDTDLSETVWAGYVGQEPPQHAFGLDSELHRLLVPEPLETCQARKYPELKGGPYEWLVIPNYMISYDGSRCDKVGVGYEAFVKQPDRCNMPRGTCLKNQPKDLWCHDHVLEEKGKTGSYFLKYYGFLPSNPIQNSSDECENLTLYFRGAYINTLNIELKTDYNLVLRPNAAAAITEVYVDSTNYIKSTITVKITNTGLVQGVFLVALTDCPLDMPASFNNIQTRAAMIPPQHQHTFIIEIMCSLPEKKFYCSVEAKNIKNELLAFRRIRFQRSDRCICIWHCVCTCLEADGGLKCQPLPFDHYNAAGFHGGLPVAADYVRFTLIEELMTLLYHLFLTMTFILVLMGIIKGIIGIFYKPIGEWGLCSMLGLPKPMKSYHEKSLRGREVVYDICGWPIHPDTKKRVRNASMIVEFCINAIFFLIYPLVMINVIVRRMCFVEASDESDKQPCCLCGQKHETGECPSLGILKGLGFYKKNKKSRKCPSYQKKYRDMCVQYSSQEIVDCSCY